MTNKVARICPGCGAEFQSEHPGEPGFLPPGVRDRHSDGERVCQACYRLSHYGEFKPRQNWDDARYRERLREALSLSDCAVLIVDLLDFEGSWWPEIWSEIPEGYPIYIVGNKADLLPKITQADEVQTWVKRQVRLKGRHAKEVFLVSARTGQGLDELKRRLLSVASSVAVIGATNTGKSSVIQALAHSYGQHKGGPVISAFPGTTLGVIPIQMGQESFTFLDTPGLIPPGRLSDYYCSRCAPQFIPNKLVKSKLFQLKPGQSLMFGGVAALTVEESRDQQGAVLLCYVPDGIVLHRTKAQRISEVLDHSGDWLVPPCAECSVPEYASWESTALTLRPQEDLAIAGLGWISLRRAPAHLRIELLPGTRMRVRSALIGPRD